MSSNIFDQLITIAGLSTKADKAFSIDQFVKQSDDLLAIYQMVLDKDVRFFVATGKIDQFSPALPMNEDSVVNSSFKDLLTTLSKEELRGNEAIRVCNNFLTYIETPEQYEMFINVLESKPRIGIGATDINKYCRNFLVEQFEVMFAKTYQESRVDKKKTYVVQPKIDGNRCIAIKIPGQNIKFYSRTGKAITSLNHIGQFLNRVPYGLVFDGEIENLGSLEKTGAVRRKSEQVDTATYTIFGVYPLKEWETKKFTERYSTVLENLDSIVSVFKDMTDKIRVIPTYLIQYSNNFDAELADLYNVFLKEGYEGAVLKTADHIYQPSTGSKRSYDWMKIKPWEDSEAKILSILEGEGEAKGITGKFEVNWNGVIFELAPGNIDKEMCKYIFEHQDNFIGKTVKLKHVGVTEKGVPRNASAIMIREKE